MKRLLLVALACLSSAVGAQDFRQRADEGESIMATEAGDAYLRAIAPELENAVRACAEEAARLAPGEAVTLVARVARDGAWSAVQTSSGSPASACLMRRLRSAQLAPPVAWIWERGDFPLTLSIGAGRGTINGIRQGD